MNEFTPLPPEFNGPVGEFTPPVEAFTDPGTEFSNTDSAPPVSARPKDRKNTVKKLLAAGTAVAAASWGVMGGLGNMGRALSPSRVPRENVVFEEVITPGDAVETWTGPGAPAWTQPPAEEQTPEPTPEPTPEASAEPSVEPSEDPAEAGDTPITPGDAAEVQTE